MASRDHDLEEQLLVSNPIYDLASHAVVGSDETDDGFRSDGVPTEQGQKSREINPRWKIIGVASAGFVAVVIGIVALAGGFASNDSSSPTNEAALHSYETALAACKSDCSLSASTLGVPANAPALHHLASTFGNVQLSDGSWTFSPTAFRGKRVASCPVERCATYTGLAHIRNMTFNSTIFIYYKDNTTTNPAIGMNLIPMASSRPQWVDSDSDKGLLSELVGLNSLPVVIGDDRCHLTYASTTGFGVSQGVHVEAMVNSANVPGISALMMAGRRVAADVSFSVYGSLLPKFDLNATVPRVDLGGFHLTNVVVNIAQPNQNSTNVTTTMTGTANVPLSGQQSLTWDLVGDVNEHGDIHINAYSSNSVDLQWHAGGISATILDSSLSLSTVTPSLWGCSAPDWTQQCPSGWVPFNKTSCVDPGFLTCANLTTFGSTYPPQLRDLSHLGNCDEIDCDCACLAEEEWPGVNNATANEWRRQGCPRHLQGARSNCTGFVNVETRVDKEAFVASCPLAPWPCTPNVTAHMTGHIRFGSDEDASFSAGLNEANMVGVLQLRDFPLGSSNVLLKNGRLALEGDHNVNLTGTISLEVPGAPSAGADVNVSVEYMDGSIKASGSAANVPLPHGMEITDVSINVVVPQVQHAGDDVAVSVDGSLTIGSRTFSANAAYNGSSGFAYVDLAFIGDAPANTSSAISSLCDGFGCSIASAPLPSSSQSAVGGLSIADVKLRYTTATPALELTATVDFSDSLGNGDATLMAIVAPQNVSGSGDWEHVAFAVDVAVYQDLTLTELIPSAATTSLGSLLQGNLLFSTFNSVNEAAFPADWYSKADAVVDTPGASFVGKVPVTALDTLGFPKDVWAPTKIALVKSTFASDTAADSFMFQIVLPSDGLLATGVTLQSGELVLVHNGTNTITGTLGIEATHGSIVPVTVTGTENNGVFDLSGTGGPWTLRDQVVLSHAAVSFTFGVGAEPHGTVSGSVDIDGATIDASLSLPGLTGSIDIDIPHLDLGTGLKFVNITIDAATGNEPSDGIHVHGVLEINVPGNSLPLDIDASAVFVGGGYEVSATLPSWEIDHAVTLNDVSIVISGSGNSSTPTTAVLNGTAITPIGTVAITTSLPFSDDGLVIVFHDWTLAAGVILQTGRISVQDGGTTITAVTMVDSSDSQTLAFGTAGTFPIGGGALLSGNMTGNWTVNSRLGVSDVHLNLDINGTAPSLTVDGNIAGTLDFAGTLVNVDMAIPITDGTSSIEIPTLRLDSHVTLHNVDVSFSDHDGSTSIDFSGECNIDTGADEEPIVVSVTGSSSPSSLHFSGTLTNWVAHIGKDSFDLRSLVVGFTKAGNVTSGSVSAVTTLGETNVNASIAFPSPSGVSGVVIELSIVDDEAVPLTPVGVVSTLSNANTAHAASIGQSVMMTPLYNATMRLVTSPPMFSLVASTTLFGQHALDVDILIKEATTSVWGYAVQVRLSDHFTASNVFGQSAGSFIDGFNFTSGGVRVADPPSVPFQGNSFWSTIPSHVATVDNVVVMGTLQFNDLEEKMSTASLWAGSNGTTSSNLLLAWTGFGFDGPGDDVALNVTLPDDLPIGNDFVINNGTVLIQESEPHFDLRTVATIKLGKLTPLTLECLIVESDAGFNITTAYIHNSYVIPVGGHGIDASGVSFTGSISRPSMEFSGTVRGIVVLADFTFDMTVTYPYNAATGLEVQLNAHTTVDTSITLSQLGGAIIPDTTLRSFGGIIGSPLTDVSLTIETNPVSFKVYAFTEGLFHTSNRLSVNMAITDRTHFWSWAFGVGIGAPFKLSDISSDWHLLSSLSPLNQGGLVVSSYPQEFTIPGSSALFCVEGVTVFGDFPMLNNSFHEVAKITGINSVLLEGSYSFESSRLHLDASISTDWHIGNFLYLKNTSLFLDLPGTKGQGAFDMGLSAYFNVRVGKPSTPHNMLDFDADLIVGSEGFSLEAGMNTPWIDPFGIHGVTVMDTEVELGLSFADLMPYLFGVSGGLKIGNFSGSATVFVDVADPEEFVLAGNLSHFSLAEVIEKLTFDTIPEHMADTIFDVTLDNVSLMVNLDPETIYFNHQTFRPGFKFSVEEFTLWFLKGSASMAIVRDYVSLNVAVQPFSICNGVVKVGGMNSAGDMTNQPLSLGGSIGKVSTMDYFDLSADAKFLDVMDVGAYINISATDGFTFALEYQMEPLFHFFMNLSLTHEPTVSSGADVDFSLYADLGLDLPAKVEAAVTKFLESVKKSADDKLNEAQSALAKWQQENGAKIAQEEQEITQKQHQISQAEDQHKAALEAKIQALKSDNATLVSYESQKTKYEQEKEKCHHWYDAGCDAHNAWCDAKITWVDTKIALYKGYVDVKKAALEAEGWVEGAAADVDEALNPEIDALRIQIAAHATLKATEDGLQSAVRIAEDGANDFIKGLMDFEGAVLGLRSLIVSCDSVAGIKHGDTCTLGVNGTFLGHSYDWHVDFIFPPSFDNIVKSIWTTIKSDFHL